MAIDTISMDEMRQLVANDTGKIVAFLFANVPPENPKLYIKQKQLYFKLFVNAGYLEFLNNKELIRKNVKHIMLMLIRVGFVSKRKGDLSIDESRKLASMIGGFTSDEIEKYELSKDDKSSLISFIKVLKEVVNLECEMKLIDDNNTMHIRRDADIPALKLK